MELLKGVAGSEIMSDAVRIFAGTLAVLIIIFAIPIVVYGIFSAITGLQPPGESPSRFLLGVLVSKSGTALAFVLIFYMARNIFGEQWLAYAAIWWLMFVLGEIGQAIGPGYSWEEAVAGIISETIYLPLSAFALTFVFRA